MTTATITIEQLEALANQVANDDESEHARLLRLCRAMLRILGARQPEAFERTCTEITDEAGHWDNSYPPKPERHGRGPRVICIFAHQTDDVPTSSGFYHSWRRQTDCVGCYAGRDGNFYGCRETGTGAVGQYAAHPGTHARAIELDWHVITPDLQDLREAEPILRAALAKFLGVAA